MLSHIGLKVDPASQPLVQVGKLPTKFFMFLRFLLTHLGRWFAFTIKILRKFILWHMLPDYNDQAYVTPRARAHLEISRWGNLKFNFSGWCQFRRSSKMGKREQLKWQKQIGRIHMLNTYVKFIETIVILGHVALVSRSTSIWYLRSR